MDQLKIKQEFFINQINNLDKFWKDFFYQELKKDYFPKLINYLNQINQKTIIIPKLENIFNVFKFISKKNIKVVIVGEEPYPNLIDAHGLAFSSLNSKTPKSLKNIFTELNNSLKINHFDNNDLTNWVKQGVLLYNFYLVRTPLKEFNHNYLLEIFSINLFKYLNKLKKEIIFVLLGKFAWQLIKYIDLNKNYVIALPHPSPLSAYRGFLNSNLFITLNKLTKNTINWIL